MAITTANDAQRIVDSVGRTAFNAALDVLDEYPAGTKYTIRADGMPVEVYADIDLDLLNVRLADDISRAVREALVVQTGLAGPR